MKRRVRLGVNIDHIATLRQARGTRYPDPILAASMAELSGADGITIHPREDRRHIQEHDVWRLRDSLQIPMNLEMAVTAPMIDLALKVRPPFCCLVPEKREELTTEGGLDVAGQESRIAEACEVLGKAGISVSLFIDPEAEQIEAARRCGAPAIELHTGRYAEASTRQVASELQVISTAVALGRRLGLTVNAGHGLHYHNVQAIAAIPGIHELNIGHSIVARAVFTGFAQAVSDMRRLLDDALLSD